MRQPNMRRLAPLLLLLAPLAGAWTWPVSGPVLQAFSFDRAQPYAAGQHRGIDVGAPAGSLVVAPAAGVVAFAGTVPASGKTITIDTPGGLAVTLTHLGSITVADGATVAEGAIVGAVGPIGTAEHDVPYVHMGVRLASDPDGYLDPLSFLPAAAQAPAHDSSPTAQAPAVESPAAAPAPVQQAAPAAPAAAAPPSPEASAPAQPAPAAQPTIVRARATQPSAPAAPQGASRTAVVTHPAAPSAGRTRPAPAPESRPARDPERLRAPEHSSPGGARA